MQQLAQRGYVMRFDDPSFVADGEALVEAANVLTQKFRAGEDDPFANVPEKFPDQGAGDAVLLPQLANLIIGHAHHLDAPTSFAHMDPPTPWLSWAMTLWNARLNQNLLHPATAPVARDIEARVVNWLAPYFGMDGGHMVSGSTIANLTALWAAREIRGIDTITAPDTAHTSIEKSARILGLRYRPLATDVAGRLRPETAKDLERACLVLVAGATSTGVVDPLDLAGRAAWTHVDAAWAGPLRLSNRYAARLAGIEEADSVAVSAHKWLFQAKESALVLFADTKKAHDALSFGGAYLAVPNIGLMGSHGAIAVPLFATLWAWGRNGLASRLDRCMAAAERFGNFVSEHESLELFAKPETGVVVWRARDIEFDAFASKLPTGMASQTRIVDVPWLRCVAANPLIDVDAVIGAVKSAIRLA